MRGEDRNTNVMNTIYAIVFHTTLSFNNNIPNYDANTLPDQLLTIIIIYTLSTFRLPCRWAKDTIVVLDEVVITPPYNVENCRANSNAAGSLERVKKVVCVGVILRDGGLLLL